MNVTSINSTVRNTVEEATETAAQTKTEAAKGDQQAIRKLASQQSLQQVPSAHQPLTPQGSRNILDKVA
jgi:anti-sigma28 factor (negative regulator of flagellin synthesis)